MTLRERSGALLEGLAGRLPPEDAERARMYYAAGEWSSLVNGLAYSLVHHRVPVTPAEKEALRGILETFDRPASRYRYITGREAVLASLDVRQDE